MAITTERERRVAELREQLSDRGLAGAVLAKPESIYYLTGLDHLGYFTPTVLVLPPSGAPVIVSREMERPTIRAKVPQCEHATFGDGEDAAVAVSAVVADLLPASCEAGVERRAMFFPPAQYEAMLAALPGVRWQDVGDLLNRQMAVKSSAEIELVRRAAAVSDAAMAAGIAAARPGVAESAIAAEIHHAMFTAGGRQPGFDPLVRPLSMLDQEHVTWDDRVVQPDSGLFFELSGCVQRYHAPQARTVYIGQPPAGAAAAHDAAVAGLHAAQQALRPGALSGEVYKAWARATGVERPRHHCGYQVGIGFPPSWMSSDVLGIQPDGRTPIVAGMTFHLLSWILPGYAMSDTVLVTDDGAEVLTTTPSKLTVLPG